MNEKALRVTFDPDADAAFFYLVDKIGWGEATNSRVIPIELKGSSIIVSLDDTGRALGVEFLGASNQFSPQMLEALGKVTERPGQAPPTDRVEPVADVE